MLHRVYPAFRLLLRVALAVFFAEIEVEGDEEVPDGPILLAATHPNAFMDVALVATRLPRRVHFVAKAPLFKNRIRGWFLRSVGAVPVERRQESADGALDPRAQEKNAASLAACEAVVAQGGAVLIFPEGTSEFVPKLLPLKTGVARIALGAEAQRGQRDVHVVPVALRYDAPQTFRSRARVQFLAPIAVAPFRELARTDPQGAVRALTAAVRDALEPSVVHAPDPALAAFVSDLDALYGRQLDAARAGETRLAAAPAIAQAVTAFAERAPERLAQVRGKLDAYKAALAGAGVDDATVRARVASPTWGQTLALVLSLPLALWGIVHHFLPFRVPRLVALLVRDPASVAGVKLMIGIVVFLWLYAGAGLAVGWRLGPWAGAAWGLSLPVSGVVALEVLEAVGTRRRRRRREKARAALGPERLGALEASRAELFRELDAARAELLAARTRGGLEPAPEEGFA